ncbi:hypothetical protein N9R79_07840 [Vibrio sp.]|nr:hypothetical protein [Vibrio sp.]
MKQLITNEIYEHVIQSINEMPNFDDAIKDDAFFLIESALAEVHEVAKLWDMDIDTIRSCLYADLTLLSQQLLEQNNLISSDLRDLFLQNNKQLVQGILNKHSVLIHALLNRHEGTCKEEVAVKEIRKPIIANSLSTPRNTIVRFSDIDISEVNFGTAWLIFSVLFFAISVEYSNRPYHFH